MPRDRAKNFLKRAKKVTLNNSSSSFKDFIGDGDDDDLYRVRVTNRSSFDLKLSGLKSNADVEIYTLKGPRQKVLRQIGTTDFSDLTKKDIRKNLQMLTRSRKGGKRNEAVSAELDAGEYYVRVKPRNSKRHSTNYKLILSAEEIVIPPQTAVISPSGETISPSAPPTSVPPASDPPPSGGGTAVPSSDENNTHLDAQLIQVDFKARRYEGYVGDADTDDYYKFSLQNGGDFTLTMFGLSADADVELLGGDGQVLSRDTQNRSALSALAGTNNETINYRLDVGGDYLIRVYQGIAGQNTDYTFNVAVVPGPDGAGNTPETARVLRGTDGERGFVNEFQNTTFTEFKRFSDFVGGADLADYYKITFEENDFFLSLDLNDLQADLDIELLIEKGGTLQAVANGKSERSGTASEAFGGSFAPGTYYLKVASKGGNPDIGSFYNLDISGVSLDGIPALTRDIKIDTSGLSSPSSDVREITGVTSGEVYFVANDGSGEAIWVSDGTFDTTNKLDTGGKTFTQISNLTDVGGVIFFAADGGDGNGVELWQVDGGAISLVANINENTATTGGNASFISSNPRNLANFNGTLYFIAAADGVNEQLYNYAPGGSAPQAITTPDVSSITELTDFDGTLYFTAANNTNGIQLYRINGSGAAEIVDIPVPTSQGDPSTFPTDLTVVEKVVGGAVEKTLYFTAVGNSGGTDTGREIWKITSPNGTAQIVEEIRPGSDSADPMQLIEFNDTLFFVARRTDGGANQTELWKLEGDTPVMVTSRAGEFGYQPDQLTVVSNTLYFTAEDGSGRELWKTDGTTFSQVLDINLGSDSSTPQNLIAVGDTLYFTADNGIADGPDAIGRELWKTDGTAENTVNVDDIWVGTQSSIPLNPEFVNVNGRLFFTASNGNETVTTTVNGQDVVVGKGVELWVVGQEIPAL
ncbi:MAG: pre-peptidase C-terminal domain-containing protein [Elainellaceae cyanobacterium]